jgi:hypothetical protein
MIKIAFEICRSWRESGSPQSQFHHRPRKPMHLARGSRAFMTERYLLLPSERIEIVKYLGRDLEVSVPRK